MTERKTTNGEEPNGSGSSQVEVEVTEAAPATEPTPTEDEAVREALARKEAELAALRKELLYQRAEVDNFKRRTEKRYQEAMEFATEPLLRELLPVLDNLDRALAHARETGNEDFGPLLTGLDHVILQFRETLERHGVQPVEAEGARFDPTFHDALAQVPGPEDGLVGEVFEKGYTLKGRLLRPAKVTVTKVASPERDG